MIKKVLFVIVSLAMVLSSIASAIILPMQSSQHIQAADPPQDCIKPMVAAGSYHTLALQSDGIVIAVGYNNYGQCNVSSWTNITQVAAGWFHTVGLKSDGTVVAIGYNDQGQCAVNGWTDIVQVAAGGYYTIGLKSDGTAVAVGSNYYGQCDVSDWINITQVAAGDSHTVGLKPDGTVVAIGYNGEGECNVSGWTNITQLSARTFHTVGLKSDGSVVAVGENSNGECNVSDWTGISQVAAGGQHTVGLKSDGSVVVAGSNGHGQCNVGGWTGITQVAAGLLHTVGLGSDGTVVAVGYNDQGQCNVANWNLAPGKPANTLPANGATGVGFMPTLQWSPIDEAENYSLQLSTEEAFNTTVLDLTGITNTSYALTTPLNQSTAYYWHVKAVSCSGFSSNWSDTWNFMPMPMYNLNTSVMGNGSITTNSSNPHLDGSVVLVTAVPDPGWTFICWEGDLYGNTSPATILMDDDKSITATFTQITYTLTYNAGAHGSINGSSTQTVNCGANGSTVTAVPATCYHFVNWSDGSTANPRTDTNVTANLEVTAFFAIDTFQLITSSTDGGNVTAPGEGTNSYKSGQEVNLVATPVSCYHFVNWTGDTINIADVNASSTTTVMNGSYSIVANFAIDTYTLTYNAEDGGSINGSSTQTVNCGANGSTVTAVPDTCYHFVNWSDSSTANPRTDINVSSNISVTANFALNTYTLTYNAGAHGSINGSSPQTVNCGTDSSTVTAIPSACYHFVNWSDGVTTASRADTDVNADITVTANFAINNYTLTTSGTNGSVTTPGQPGPFTYNCGQVISIQATPANASCKFVNWTGDTGTIANVSSNSTTITMNSNYSIQANFVITGPTTKTYIFTSGGGTNKWCSAGHIHLIDWSNGHPHSPSDLSSSPTYGFMSVSSTEYAQVSSSDNSYWRSNIAHDGGCCAGDRNAELFTFKINESPATITNIQLKWEGHGTTGGTFYYTTEKLWKYSNGTWNQLRNQQNLTSDTTWTNNISSSCSDYIESGTGNLSVLVASQRSGLSSNCGIWTDYIEVTITHN